MVIDVKKHHNNISGRIVTPSLVVGLGTTGFQVLRHLSGLFRENETFGHEVPPMVRLINIDTDPPPVEVPGIETVVLGGGDSVNCPPGSDPALEASGVTGVDADTEASLGPGNDSVAESPAEVSPADSPDIAAWLPDGLSPEDIRSSRLHGRVALFKNVEQVLAALKYGIAEISRKRHLTGRIKRTPDEVPANVYIISSLCGHTGGGMFMDVAYIIRELFRRKGKKQPEMQGYFFLADTFEQTLPERMEELTANMVAALKELDFFMENMEDFTVRYRKNLFYISDEAAGHKPFDFSYLVSAIDITSIVTLEKVTAVSVFHALATELGKGNKSFLSTVSAQAFKPVRSGPFRGRYTSYSSLGVSSMVFPHRRVIEMGACQFAANVTDEILEFVKTRKDPKPWNNQLRDFLFETGLFEQNRVLRFAEGLLQGGSPRRLSPTKYKKMDADYKYEELAKDKKDTDRINSALVSSMKTALEVQTEDFERILDDTLLAIMGDEDKGVRFAVKFLHKLRITLEQTCTDQRSAKEMAEKNYAFLESQAAMLRKELKEETERFFLFRNRSFMNEAAQNCLDTANRASAAFIAGHKASMTMQFSKQALKMVEERTKKLEKLESELVRMADKFAVGGIPESLEGELFHDDESDWLLNDSVVGLTDIKTIYREIVGDFQGFEAWVVGDEVLDMSNRWEHYCAHPEELENTILDCGRKLVRDYVTGMTIEAFLEEKAKSSGNDEFTPVGENLGYEAKPLWNINNHLYPDKMEYLNLLGVYDQENTLMVDYIVPYLPTKEPPCIVSTQNPHRITLVETAHGAPLYAFRGIASWEEIYDTVLEERALHCITEKAYGIKWAGYSFRPQQIEMGEIFKYFSLACVFGFVRPLKWDGRVHYFLCFDEDGREEPEKMRDLDLGRNRMQAFESFASCPYVRKCKHLVDKTIDSLGRAPAGQRIVSSIEKLKQHLKNLKDDKYRRFLTLEIKELMAVREELAE